MGRARPRQGHARAGPGARQGKGGLQGRASAEPVAKARSKGHAGQGAGARPYIWGAAGRELTGYRSWGLGSMWIVVLGRPGPLAAGLGLWPMPRAANPTIDV